MLKILGKAASINVRKVLWTADELGIKYEREDWGSGFRPTSEPAFMALNPNAMVPVIIDDDVVLWESNAICRYLCSKVVDGTLLPSDPPSRAHVEQWMDWQATEFNNAWRYAFMGLVRGSPAHQDPAMLQAGIENWNRHIGILDRQLTRTGDYITGAGFSLADIVIGLSVHRWIMAPMERPCFHAVQAYWERLSRRPGFQAHALNGWS